MSVREIVEYAKGRLPTKSKTPDTVVARDLSMDIKRKGDSSLFARTAPGRYTMRSFVDEASRSDGDGTTSVIASAIKRERAGTLSAPAPQSSSAHADATSSSH